MKQQHTNNQNEKLHTFAEKSLSYFKWTELVNNIAYRIYKFAGQREAKKKV